MTQNTVTCSDLVEEGKWLKHFCCTKCHSEEGLIEDTLEDGKYAKVCCRAAYLLHPTGLPSHEQNAPGDSRIKCVISCKSDKTDIAIIEKSFPDREDKHHSVYYSPGLPRFNGIGLECTDKEAATKLYNALQHVSKFSMHGGVVTSYVCEQEINTNFSEL